MVQLEFLKHVMCILFKIHFQSYVSHLSLAASIVCDFTDRMYSRKSNLITWRWNDSLEINSTQENKAHTPNKL